MERTPADYGPPAEQCRPAAVTLKSIPKVEYKREGMRLFEQMWQAVGNYVTNLIFKMEQLDEGFVGSTWVEVGRHPRRGPQYIRNCPATTGGHRRFTQSDRNGLEPIRNRQDQGWPQPAMSMRQW